MWKIIRNYSSEKLINVAGDKIISDYICMIYLQWLPQMVVRSVDGELSVGQTLHTIVIE